MKYLCIYVDRCVHTFLTQIWISEASCKSGKLFASIPPGLSCQNDKDKEKKKVIATF